MNEMEKQQASVVRRSEFLCQYYTEQIEVYKKVLHKVSRIEAEEEAHDDALDDIVDWLELQMGKLWKAIANIQDEQREVLKTIKRYFEMQEEGWIE